MFLEFQAPGFSNHKIAVQPAGFFRGPRLIVDGKITPRSGAGYWVQQDDGITTLITLKRNIIDPIPQLTVAGRTYELAPPLRWYEFAWMGLPILLIFLGGFLGAVIGIIGTRSSAEIFRANCSRMTKYLLTGLLSTSCFAAYLSIVLLIQILQLK